MANPRYTMEQILVILHEIDHLRVYGQQSTEEAVQRSGITMEAYYLWRKKYGWMSQKDAERIRELENENTKLKRLISLWQTMFLEENVNDPV